MYHSKKYQKYVANYLYLYLEGKQISMKYFLTDKKCIFVSDTRDHNFYQECRQMLQTEKLLLSIDIKGDSFTGKKRRP